MAHEENDMDYRNEMKYTHNNKFIKLEINCSKDIKIEIKLIKQMSS